MNSTIIVLTPHQRLSLDFDENQTATIERFDEIIVPPNSSLSDGQVTKYATVRFSAIFRSQTKAERREVEIRFGPEEAKKFRHALDALDAFTRFYSNRLARGSECHAQVTDQIRVGFGVRHVEQNQPQAYDIITVTLSEIGTACLVAQNDEALSSIRDLLARLVI